MRREAYRVFEIVAWPAAAWCAIEVALRTATGALEGLPATLLLGAMASATIITCRSRTRQIAPAAAASTLR